MQEIKKRSIVLASVLKPVDDTRMTDKMAISLVQTDMWDVHVIGFGSTVPTFPLITFHPIGIFHRISLKRLLIPWKVLSILLKVRPEQVIIATHELLLIGFIYRMFSGAKIYYDVQENYLLNILNTNSFPPGLRYVIGYYVRLKEHLFSFSITGFLLAEKCYSQELKFVGKRFTIIENKCLKPKTIQRTVLHENKLNLIFTGTLDNSTGVFEAITFSKIMYAFNRNITLTIVGYAARTSVQSRIRQEIHGHNYIKAIGIESLVPHREIIRQILNADVGLICYRPERHTQNRIPTKLYEYIAYQLPVLFQHDASWLSIATKADAGIPVNFNAFTPSEIIQALTSHKFYSNPAYPATWDSEEQSLLHMLS